MTWIEQYRQRSLKRQSIFNYMKAKAEPVNTKQIATATGLTLRRVQEFVKHLCVLGMVFRSYYGDTYVINPNPRIKSV